VKHDLIDVNTQPIPIAAGRYSATIQLSGDLSRVDVKHGETVDTILFPLEDR